MSVRPSIALSLAWVAFVALLFVGPAGCGSLSNSSESISDSFMSPFRSSSNSSGDDGAYRQDVEAVTVAFLSESAPAGRPDASFARSLGRVAEQYGVVDWESLDATYLAIGSGLRRGGLDAQQARAFGRELFGTNARAERLLLEGFTGAEAAS